MGQVETLPHEGKVATPQVPSLPHDKTESPLIVLPVGHVYFAWVTVPVVVKFKMPPGISGIASHVTERKILQHKLKQVKLKTLQYHISIPYRKNIRN